MGVLTRHAVTLTLAVAMFPNTATAAVSTCKPRLVGASMFTDRIGDHDNPLWRRPAYAELGMGTALGGLPRGYGLRISYRHRQVVAYRDDIGLGGGPVFALGRSWKRRIDLHALTASRLRFPYGLDVVRIAPASCPEFQSSRGP